MSKRFSIICAIICGFAAICGLVFGGLKFDYYEYRNGPGLLSNRFFDLLRKTKSGIEINYLTIQTPYRKSTKDKDFAIISRNLGNNKITFGTIESFDRKTYRLHATQNASLHNAKGEESIFNLSLKEMNKKVDKIFFPDRTTRIIEKKEIMKRLEELNQ